MPPVYTQWVDAHRCLHLNICIEISYVSTSQNPTLANVFLIITGPISQLAPSNSLPAISRKTNCKVTHFFLIADYCHVGIGQISLQEWRNCPARTAQLRHTSDGTRARTGWNELVRRMKRGLAPNDASRIKRRFCGVF